MSVPILISSHFIYLSEYFRLLLTPSNYPVATELECELRGSQIIVRPEVPLLRWSMDSTNMMDDWMDGEIYYTNRKNKND